MHLIVEVYTHFASLVKWLWANKTSQGISTCLVAFVMLLKLFVNNKATTLQKKTLAVSIPGELTVLIMGFLISSAVSDDTSKDYLSILFLIIFSLILLVILYALERSLEDQLIGKWNLKVWMKIIFMYILGGGFYLLVVFGGML